MIFKQGVAPQRNTREQPVERKRSFAVIGLGTFGATLASALAGHGMAVLAINHNASVLGGLHSRVQYACIDATDEAVLRSVGICSYDTVVVTIATDFNSNLMATVALQRLGVRDVISRAVSRKYAALLLRLGARGTVDVDQEQGERLAAELVGSHPMLDHRSSSNLKLLVIELPTRLRQMSLSQFYDQAQGALVLAIRRGDRIIAPVSRNVILARGDFLVILGDHESLAALHAA